MEAIGLAASGIAFGQLAASIVKVIHLWRQGHDFPEELEDLFRSLDILKPILYVIKREFDQYPDILTQSSAKACLEYATQAEESLASFAKVLRDRLKTPTRSVKRNLNRVRVVFKKDEVVALQNRLSWSLQLLHLSIDCYHAMMRQTSEKAIVKATSEQVIRETRALYDAFQDGIVQRISAELLLHVAKQTSSTANLVAEQERHSRQKSEYTVVKATFKGLKPASYHPSSLGQFGLQSSKQGARLQFYVQPPRSQSIWEFQLLRAVAGRQFNFRYYTIRSRKSEIFNVIRRGDVSAMLSLFGRGEASPFDRDEHGSSLLYYAADSMQVEVCKKLIDMGLDVLIDDKGGYDKSPLDELIYGYNLMGPQKENRKTLVNLFQRHSDDLDSLTVSRMFEFEREFLYGDTYLKLFQADFMPDYRHLPMREKAEAVRLGAFTVQDSRTYRSLIQENRTITAKDVQESVKEGFSLMHSAAIAMSKRFTDEQLQDPRILARRRYYGDDWSRIVTDTAMVADTSDLHSIETVTPWDWFRVPVWRGTPLISMLGGALCRLHPVVPLRSWNKMFTMALKQWLRDLKAAGIDLTEYGMREAYILRLGYPEVKGAFDADAIAESRKLIRNPLDKHTRNPWMNRVDDDHDKNDIYWIPVRLIGLEYGPTPEDWRIWWAPEFEAMAGEFWRMAERPVTNMPGSWVE